MGNAMRARRIVLSLLAGMVFALPSAAGSHATQAPGWFRYTAGDFTVTALQDGVINLPPGGFKGIPAEQIQALSARAFSYSDKGVPTSVNAYLVDTGAHRILVDAGNAECYGWKLGGLAANLKASGYAPGDIDILVLTHLHGDHVCGLVENGKKLFPKAAVWADAKEAAYWLDAQNKATPAGAREALALYGRNFHTFKPGDVIAPGMTIVPAPGHTPGHTAFRFESKGAALLVFGDIVHNSFVQFAHPEVSVMSDTDRAQAVATRQELFAKAAAENTPVAGAHVPFPGIGRLRKDGNGYVFVPVEFGPQP
jgi:glyoxylase-like metal-dependent hydrolase (beta-lactamase superfamily II)